MREDARSKARRLLAEGRVIVKAVNERAVVATVRGDSGVIYRVVGDPTGFRCPCPAVGPCSHGMAVALVALLPLALDGLGPYGGPARGQGRGVGCRRLNAWSSTGVFRAGKKRPAQLAGISTRS
jgi:hypothetical protein